MDWKWIGRYTFLGVLLLVVGFICTGCYRIQLVPSVQVVVFNDCKGSTLFLGGPHLKRLREIPYGSFYAVRLDASFGGRYERPLLFVEGRDASGKPLGSASRNFSISAYEERDESWHVGNLRGGKGCGR